MWRRQNPSSDRLSGGSVQEEMTLVQATLAGDGRAFERLVDRHQQAAYGLAMRYLRDGGAAESACVEAFEKAYRGLKGFDGRAGFGTWLTTIIVNTCKSKLRSIITDRQRLISLDDSEDQVKPIENTPRSAVMDEEMKEQVNRAIESLPPKLRSAWILFALEGLQVSQIAQVEQCSVGAIKNRLFHARRQLQEKLEKYLKDEI